MPYTVIANELSSLSINFHKIVHLHLILCFIYTYKLCNIKVIFSKSIIIQNGAFNCVMYFIMIIIIVFCTYNRLQYNTIFTF